jgi:hypothetical protein
MLADGSVKALALDLEGTLISNAISQIARPGLHDFLEFCHSNFPRVVVYTGVREERFRRVAHQLIVEGQAPRWFGHVPHVYWDGDYKDLRTVPGAALHETVIVDDMEECIHPDQKRQWIPVRPYEQPYSETDSELERLKRVLGRLGRQGLDMTSGSGH